MNIEQSISTMQLMSEWFNATAGMFTSISGAALAGIALFFTFSGICARLASVMPKPNETAPISYKLLHRFVNRMAFNYGHAENKS